MLSPAPSEPPAALLPPFDEYLIGYRDRSAALDFEHRTRVVPGSNGMFNPIIVVGGRVVGVWRREIKRDTVTITLDPFAPWSDGQSRAIAAAAERYGGFLGKTAVVLG